MNAENKKPRKRKTGVKRVGRPVANKVRISVTLDTEDYLLLDEIATRTATRPATMIRELILECKSTYESMLMALKSIESGNSTKAMVLMEKSLKEAQAKAENEIEKTKK